MTEATNSSAPTAVLGNYERVVYANNPLVEVVLQVSFPTFLRLQADSPSDFQEKIIGEYPHYQLDNLLQVGAQSTGSPPTLMELKVHRFLSKDKFWQASLSSDSISLSTRKYEHWQDFSQRAAFCIETFFGLYPIRLITRIGLRYRNLIEPGKLNKPGAKWRDLINPLLLGPMGAKSFDAFAFTKDRWNHRFILDQVAINFQGGLRKQDGKSCYFLDCDASLSKELLVGNDWLRSELETLHEPIGPLFRWAITDELHQSLGPRPA